MAAAAFCPAYATGIFTIGENGAAGAGFTLSKGLHTSVSSAKSGEGSITIGGRKAPAPVSKAVLARFAKKGCSLGRLDISHSPEVPVGFGLGMSAAGALSLSLALNEFLGAGFPRQECVKIAHDAEVECGTGLSGVDAASFGGFLFQEKIGQAPSVLNMVKRKLYFAFFSPMRTSDVIFSPDWKKRVNAAGEKALHSLSEKRDFDSFVSCCRKFSLESGLSGWGNELMRKNPRACMAMLGHTLFSDEKLVGVEAASTAIEAEAPAGRAELE
jgi:pantoate kinase